MFKLIGVLRHDWIKKVANELYWNNEGYKVRRKAERELAKNPLPKYKLPTELGKTIEL